MADLVNQTYDVHAQPGWYRDPTGHNDFRYWDGRVWTDRVLRDGWQVRDAVSGGSARHRRSLVLVSLLLGVSIVVAVAVVIVLSNMTVRPPSQADLQRSLVPLVIPQGWRLSNTSFELGEPRSRLGWLDFSTEGGAAQSVLTLTFDASSSPEQACAQLDGALLTAFHAGTVTGIPNSTCWAQGQTPQYLFIAAVSPQPPTHITIQVRG